MRGQHLFWLPYLVISQHVPLNNPWHVAMSKCFWGANRQQGFLTAPFPHISLYKWLAKMWGIIPFLFLRQSRKSSGPQLNRRLYNGCIKPCPFPIFLMICCSKCPTTLSWCPLKGSYGMIGEPPAGLPRRFSEWGKHRHSPCRWFLVKVSRLFLRGLPCIIWYRDSVLTHYMFMSHEEPSEDSNFDFREYITCRN